MNEHERLLWHFVEQVRFMRKLQKQTRRMRPHPFSLDTLKAEKEVDELVELHTMPRLFPPAPEVK